MANEQNLIPIEQVNSRRTREEHSEDSAKGGRKSGEVRRKRKAMKEQMELLLALPAKYEDEKEFMDFLGIDEENWDNQMALIIALYKKAMKGDVFAFQEIRKIVQDEQATSEEDRIQIINDLPNEEDEEHD